MVRMRNRKFWMELMRCFLFTACVNCKSYTELEKWETVFCVGKRNAAENLITGVWAGKIMKSRQLLPLISVANGLIW